MLLMMEEVIPVQAENMGNAKRFHLEKEWQIRCICTSHSKPKLSLAISNVNEGSELSFSICSLTRGTTEALVVRPCFAIGCGAPNPVYSTSASAKCSLHLGCPAACSWTTHL